MYNCTNETKMNKNGNYTETGFMYTLVMVKLNMRRRRRKKTKEKNGRSRARFHRQQRQQHELQTVLCFFQFFTYFSIGIHCIYVFHHFEKLIFFFFIRSALWILSLAIFFFSPFNTRAAAILMSRTEVCWM